MRLQKVTVSQREAAEMLDVNRMTVRRYIETGQLVVGDIAPTGSRNAQRVHLQSLVDFARERNLPLRFRGQPPVLVLSQDPLTHRSLEGYDFVHFFSDPLDLAYQLPQASPVGVLFDLQDYREASIRLAMKLRDMKSQRPTVVALVPEGEPKGVLDRLWDVRLNRPFTGAAIVDVIERRVYR